MSSLDMKIEDRYEILGLVQQPESLEGFHITCDLDDVLGAYMPSFLDFYNDMKGTRFLLSDLTSSSLAEHLGESEERISEYVRDFSFTPEFRDLPVTSGAYIALKALKDNGAKLTVLTSRKLLDQTISEEYIARNYAGIFNDLICTDGKNRKGEIAADIGSDLHIDDAPKYLADVLIHGVAAIVYSARWNQGFGESQECRRASSFHDVGEIVQEIANTKLKQTQRKREGRKLRLIDGSKLILGE